MGASYSEKGGGPAVGLGQNWVNWLSQGLNTGSFGGGSPMGGGAMGVTAGGMGGILNDIFSGGAGKLGGAMNEMITRSTNDQAAALRARFGAGGGTAFGTGAQYGEAQLRSQLAPQLTSAIGQLQLGALMPILQMISQTAGKGITQREGMMQPSALSQGLGLALPAAGTFLGGPAGGAIGGWLGGMMNPTTLPGVGPMPNPNIGTLMSLPQGWTR